MEKTNLENQLHRFNALCNESNPTAIVVEYLNPDCTLARVYDDQASEFIDVVATTKNLESAIVPEEEDGNTSESYNACWSEFVPPDGDCLLRQVFNDLPLAFDLSEKNTGERIDLPVAAPLSNPDYWIFSDESDGFKILEKSELSGYSLEILL